MVLLSHRYTTTGKTIALARWTFVGKVHQTIILMNCCPHHTQLHIYSWIIISQSARAVGSNSLPWCTNSLRDNSNTDGPTAPADTFWGQGTHHFRGMVYSILVEYLPLENSFSSSWSPNLWGPLSTSTGSSPARSIHMEAALHLKDLKTRCQAWQAQLLYWSGSQGTKYRP